MGISGNLQTMVLPELLQWLSMGQKSGTLVIDNGDVEKKVFFKKGAILSSASTDPKEYLGCFLSSHGYLPVEQIEEALARQKTEKKLLGQILVNMGAISEEDLYQMLRLKTEESIYDIFTWEAGDFEFLDDQLPEETMIRMALDVQGLVLEGTRRLDEWVRIREWVPSPLSVPVSIVDLQSLELEERDLAILEWIDDDRSVEDISQGAQTSLFDVCNVIAAQAQGGTVKVVRPRTIEVEVPVEVPAVATELAPAPIAMPPPAPQPASVANPGAPAGNPIALGSGRNLRFATDAAATGVVPAQPLPDAAATGTFPAQPLPDAAATGTFPAQPLPDAAATGTFPAQQPAASAAPSLSAAAELVQQAEGALARGDLEQALTDFRKAKDAPGSDSAVASSVEAGERKVQQALERDGVRLTTVPKLKCGMDELTQVSISPQEGFMLTRVDGSYDLKSILKMSPMPPIDAQMLVWRLKKLGHVSV